MTQMWVNITCFYPICQFPKTKKQMSEDLSTVSTPSPLTQKKQNHKHTYSEAKIWHIHNHHGIFHRKGLELEVAWWHPGNLEAHHVSIRGADVFKPRWSGDHVSSFFYWLMVGCCFFKGPNDKEHGKKKRKNGCVLEETSWEFLGRGW